MLLATGSDKITQRRHDGGEKQPSREMRPHNITWVRVMLLAKASGKITPRRYSGGKKPQSRGLQKRNST